MKIKLAVSQERYEEVERLLTQRGITVDADGDFVLMENNRYPDRLMVRDGDSGERVVLPVEDIVLIEAFGHSLAVRTLGKSYGVSQRLYKILGMPPPHRVLFGLAAVVAMVGVCLIVLGLQGERPLTAERDIAADLRKNPGVTESWEVEADMGGNLAAGIAFCRETGDYSFGVYIQKGEKPGFVFRYGGQATSIKESVRAFVYGDEIALISMNALQVAQVRSASGERFYVEPGEPFALVIPGGGFEVYDAQGNPIPVTQDPWYEVTEIE